MRPETSITGCHRGIIVADHDQFTQGFVLAAKLTEEMDFSLLGRFFLFFGLAVSFCRHSSNSPYSIG
jgi:hypothetical protein